MRRRLSDFPQERQRRGRRENNIAAAARRGMMCGMNTTVVRSLVAALLALFVWLAWSENRKPDRPARAATVLQEDRAEREAAVEASGGYRSPALVFVYILVIAVGGGVIFLKWVMPAIGDYFADSLLSSTEKIEETATHRAVALVTQGEYEKAVAAYEKIVAGAPQDRFAVVELSRLHTEKLGAPAAGAAVLEQAVAREWPPEDHGFLLLRLADLHFSRLQNPARAREVLQLVQTRYPHTRHASSAHHKLNEIDEAEFLARRQQA